MPELKDYPHVDWLLTGTPRVVQLEALSRSFYGLRVADHQVDPAASVGPKQAPARGWAHFLEMRLGKTPTALNEFELFCREFGFKRLLVLSPSKYKHAWAEEAQKFGIGVPAHAFESKERSRARAFLQSSRAQGAMLAVNYEALLQDATMDLLEEWVDDRTLIVADESAMIKNPKSFFFKHALVLGKQAGATRVLSGLPAPQGPFDLWSQLRFAKQLNGFNFYAFKHTFTVLGGFKGKQAIGTKNERKLDDLLSTCSFRARRVDWGARIACDYELVKLPMLPEQKRQYDNMQRDFVIWLQSGEPVEAEQVISKHTKMQQISSGFIYSEDGERHDIVPFEKTPKWVDLLDRLQNYVRGKVIVIAHYKATVERLVRALRNAGFAPALILGDSQMREFDADVELEKRRFNGDPKCKVLVGQSSAVKYGHTLMGSDSDPCLSMAFFENNYNLDNRAQAEERPQGFGQKAAIHVWDYYGSPVERQIVEALQKKRRMAEVVMSAYGQLRGDKGKGLTRRSALP